MLRKITREEYKENKERERQCICYTEIETVHLLYRIRYKQSKRGRKILKEKKNMDKNRKRENMQIVSSTIFIAHFIQRDGGDAHKL